MPSQYPREQQNPVQREGMRPAEQPSPEERVPDGEPDVEDMTTDERKRSDPKRSDLMTPVKDADKPGRTWQ